MKYLKKIRGVVYIFTAIITFLIIKPSSAKAYNYGMSITKYNGDGTVQNSTELSSESTGLIRCRSGRLEFNYIYPNGVNNYCHLIFDAGGFHSYDSQGNHLGYSASDYYDLQAVLNQTAQGGSLFMNFYDGVFEFYGPYRVFGNTTFNAPSRNATIAKMKNTYLFINTDDATAAAFNTDTYGGIWNPNGNILFQGITFECNGLRGSVAKFVHAQNISFNGCVVQNAYFDAHMLEFASINGVSVTGCTFINTSQGHDWINPINKMTYETIQIESSKSLASFPYCKFQPQYYDTNMNCRNVTITDSRFHNLLTGIGNHQSGGSQENVILRGNIFELIHIAPIRFTDGTRY